VNSDRGDFVFAPPEARQGGRIVLSEEEAHHLFRVRRAAVGSAVWATDGAGLVCECRAGADRALEIVRERPDFGEPSVPLLLLLGALKGDMHREVVDTAVQLGATEIRLFRAAHSEGRVSADKLDKLRRVAVVAIKQCGRARLPRIACADRLASALEGLPEPSWRFVAHPVEDAGAPLAAADAPRPLVLAVGPEGGYSAEELEQLEAAGFARLTLAARRLRSETAVAAGLAQLLTLARECHVGK
jgi:16S rRNA (uracil1498-N3)-methyltransferase